MWLFGCRSSRRLCFELSNSFSVSLMFHWLLTASCSSATCRFSTWAQLCRRVCCLSLPEQNGLSEVCAVASLLYSSLWVQASATGRVHSAEFPQNFFWVGWSGIGVPPAQGSPCALPSLPQSSSPQQGTKLGLSSRLSLLQGSGRNCIKRTL